MVLIVVSGFDESMMKLMWFSTHSYITTIQKVKECVDIYLHSHNIFMTWCLVKYRDNFIFTFAFTFLRFKYILVLIVIRRRKQKLNRKVV
jgi:hypothetical protein